MKLSQIARRALSVWPRACEIRRRLHSDPQLSFCEWRTAAVIGNRLESLGIPYQSIARTGVLARIDGAGCKAAELSGKDGRTVASSRLCRRAVVLRADTDALPVKEQTGLPYASRNEGVMHACGHDMHAATLLAAVEMLNDARETFCGTVFGLFQPAEESNPGGAELVLSDDPFGDYEVEAFIGQHIDPELPTGTFGFCEGRYMASNDELRLTVRGKGGHAALRDKLRDPVVAAAEIITALHALPERYGKPELPVIVSIGKIRAEGATNVVPDEVYMEGTMRTFDEARREVVREAVRAEAACTSACRGVETEVKISEGYPCVENDAALTGRARELARSMFGASSVKALGLRPTSDDFGRYCQLYPSVYYRLGAGYSGNDFKRGRAGSLHTGTLNPDEKAMGYGAALMTALALDILQCMPED